ncbi:unnamed protein product, partial [Ectocarpus sp. 4 AP-2014]
PRRRSRGQVQGILFLVSSCFELSTSVHLPRVLNPFHHPSSQDWARTMSTNVICVFSSFRKKPSCCLLRRSSVTATCVLHTGLRIYLNSLQTVYCHVTENAHPGGDSPPRPLSPS